MRIMFWSEHFSPIIGGVERSAELLLQEMKGRGHEFVIVTSRAFPSLPNEELWHGIPLYRFEFTSAINAGDLPTWVREQKRLAQLVNSFNPEAHHIFGIGPSMVSCLQILKQKPTPVIASLANVETHPEIAYVADAVIAKTLKMATWITTVSQGILDQTIHYLPETKTRISVLYNGYPSPNLEPTPLATPSRILLLGRLVIQKGGELAITAFAKLWQRYPDARLIIAGDGPEKEKWQQLASALGDRVEFIGWVAPHRVYALLNSVTLVLIPSRWEGLPMVAIESAFMARPTIATRIVGMDEVVLDGKTGLLVEPEDAEGLANAMAHLLDNPDLATTMGLAAREWASTQFTQKRCADEHEALYRQIVEMA